MNNNRQVQLILRFFKGTYSTPKGTKKEMKMEIQMRYFNVT